MRRWLFILFVALLFTFPEKVDAGFLKIGSDGKIEYNVLSAEGELTLEVPRSEDLQVKAPNDEGSLENGTISLVKKDGKISMVIEDDTSKKEFDFTNYNDTIVEIEERPEVQRMQIGVRDEKFSIEHKGMIALTEYPVTIDPKSARITISTDRGERIVSITPYGAIESLLRAKTISSLDGNKLFLVEKGSELAYLAKGTKVLNLLNIYYYPVSVSAFVSASTGEVILVEAPVWYKIVGFLFS